MVAHRAARDVQLRPVLPAAHRGRVPLARRRGRGVRRAATVARRRAGVADLRAQAAGTRSRRRRRRRARCRHGRGSPGCRLRPRRAARGGRRQRVVRHRGGAHQAVPGTVQPGCRHRLAAAAGWRTPGSLGARCRRTAAVAHRAQRRRIRLPQSDRDGVRLRAVVQRHPPPAGRRATAARTRRSGHRCDIGMDDPRGVAVAGAAHRLRRRPGGDRLRCVAAGVRGWPLQRRGCPGVGDGEVVGHRAVGAEHDEPVEAA